MRDIMLFMKRITVTAKDFGKRLASLRKELGLTQTELGEKVGVSCRVIAYYEGDALSACTPDRTAGEGAQGID